MKIQRNKLAGGLVLTRPGSYKRSSRFAIRNGFTLIELLVVIAIISLLISILLPSLTRAKEMGKQVVCMSNQKNIGLAISMYTNENDGCLPPRYGPGYYWNNQWVSQLKRCLGVEYSPYTGTTWPERWKGSCPIFHCPSTSESPSDFRFYCRDIAGTTDCGYSSYAISQFLAPTVDDGITVKLDGVDNLAEYVYIIDGYHDATYGSFSFHSGAIHTLYWWDDGAEHVIRHRHNGKANCLFVDGHVEGLDYVPQDRVREEHF